MHLAEVYLCRIREFHRNERYQASDVPIALHILVRREDDPQVVHTPLDACRVEISRHLQGKGGGLSDQNTIDEQAFAGQLRGLV